MLKKQRRWIAFFVIGSFVCMLQVSAMPLAAAGTTDQVISADSELEPNFIERGGHASAPAKSKSILPYVLIGVGVVAVAAVLFLVVLKTEYNIVGSWTVVWRWTSGSSFSDTTVFTFTGTKESGTVTIPEYDDQGPYTVDGKKATWTLTSEDPNFVWTGQFDDKDSMSGTMAYPAEGLSGTWTATRSAAPTVTKKGSWNPPVKH